MGEGTKIEWSDNTFNPWSGCTVKADADGYKSPECTYCYAEVFARRGLRPMGDWKRNGVRVIASEDTWNAPLAWERKAAKLGVRYKVFCLSVGDIFEDHAGLDAPRARLWPLIAATPNLDWQLLTKRPENVGTMVPWGDVWPRNVWLGTTAGTQETANRRIPELLRHPAAVRFVSCEPLLSALDLAPWIAELDWIIVGGESGPKARPMQLGWLRGLRDQAVAAGVPLFFKQWGQHTFDAERLVRLRSKYDAEAMVDGVHWRQFPTAKVRVGPCCDTSAR
jgi:protein gp37